MRTLPSRGGPVLLLFLVLAALSLAACGGSDRVGAGPPTSEEERQPPPPPAAEPPASEDEDDVLPAILVASPRPGERVANPVEVTGSANVFEANVILRVLDARGEEVASDFTTATCGSGCRGDFAHVLAYAVDSAQPGTIVVSDEDADGDGAPQHEVRIPVTLTPEARR